MQKSMTREMPKSRNCDPYSQTIFLSSAESGRSLETGIKFSVQLGRRATGKNLRTTRTANVKTCVPHSGSPPKDAIKSILIQYFFGPFGRFLPERRSGVLVRVCAPARFTGTMPAPPGTRPGCRRQFFSKENAGGYARASPDLAAGGGPARCRGGYLLPSWD